MRHPLRNWLPAAALVGLLPFLPGAAWPDDDRAADRRILRDAGVGLGGADLLAYFRRLAPAPDEQERFDRLVRQLGNPVPAARDRAGWELLATGPVAQRRLRLELTNSDPEIASRARRLLAAFDRGPGGSVAVAAARELAARRTPGAVGALLLALPHLDDPGTEQEVVAALLALDRPGGDRDEALRAAVRDPQPLRRAAAAAVLGRRADPDQRAPVRALLADADPVVRWQAACALALSREGAAVPVLIDLVGGPDDLAWQAEAWLYRLAGDPTPDLPAGDDVSARQKRRLAWAGWWATAAATADLAKLAAEPVPLHLTVLTQMHAGRVVELNRDGKEVWAVENLNGPIDAQVLPGGRVLIAEHGGRQVGEYDRGGKPVWVKSLPDSPVVCQRLPSGHVFVVTYTAVYEVRPDGREIYRHASPTGQRLYAGQKLPGGRILVATVDGLTYELDAASGRVVKSLQLACPGCYGVEKLPGGNVLAASYNLDRVREFDAAGQVVWEVQLPKPYHATRLANGHTLVSSASHPRVIEVDRTGKIVWERTASNPCWHLHRR